MVTVTGIAHGIITIMAITILTDSKVIENNPNKEMEMKHTLQIFWSIIIILRISTNSH
jgi:hypothetical protein